MVHNGGKYPATVLRVSATWHTQRNIKFHFGSFQDVIWERLWLLYVAANFLGKKWWKLFKVLENFCMARREESSKSNFHVILGFAKLLLLQGQGFSLWKKSLKPQDNAENDAEINESFHHEMKRCNGHTFYSVGNNNRCIVFL